MAKRDPAVADRRRRRDEGNGASIGMIVGVVGIGSLLVLAISQAKDTKQTTK